MFLQYNIRAPRAAFRYMKENRGSIMNISSLAARCGTVGASTLYGPPEVGGNQAGGFLCREYAAYGVRLIPYFRALRQPGSGS